VRRLAIALASTVGCARAEITSVEIGGFGLDAAALLVIGADGRAVRMTPAFGPTFGEPPSIALADGETALVVGVQRASLLRAVPIAVRGAIDRIHFELGPPPSEPRFTEESGERAIRFALPPDATLVDLALAPAPRDVLANVTGTWSVPGGDNPGDLALRTFSDKNVMFDLTTVIPNVGSGASPFYRVVRAVALGPERAVIATERFVGLVDRGVPFDFAPERILTGRAPRPGTILVGGADGALYLKRPMRTPSSRTAMAFSG